MSISDVVLPSNTKTVAGDRSTMHVEPPPHVLQWTELLGQGFGCRFTLLDGLTGDVLHPADDQPVCDWSARSELIREVARRGSPEFLDDEDPLIVLAIPFENSQGNSTVAASVFLTREVKPDEDLSKATERLGISTEQAAHWATRQTPWSPNTLYRISELVLTQSRSQQRVKILEQENDSLSTHLSNTYEEISLLYRLTGNLKISAGDENLCRIALEWMHEVLPADVLAIQLVPIAQADGSFGHDARSRPVLLTYGKCPADNEQFDAMLKYLGTDAGNRPMVLNRHVTARDDWPCPQIRQMIVVALAEGENTFGWLAAINHVDDAEFGTVEASLLSSVAAILGIHSGNIELYRQQSELFEGIIRALTSAIDAKDPYTCGHSDRVAQVAVRLAEELGCDTQTLDTMYLAGLLHDVGKIGIDDSVLRKPGKLSEEQYEHIKRHSEIGHRILRDLSKLDDVLPVVLHHHESWDGSGYPEKLIAERIPLSARIVAVADAFDAMGSDRPYRKGMSDEKIDGIFRSGAGRQWDPNVVDAFFHVRDDIRKIART